MTHVGIDSVLWCFIPLFWAILANPLFRGSETGGVLHQKCRSQRDLCISPLRKRCNTHVTHTSAALFPTTRARESIYKGRPKISDLGSHGSGSRDPRSRQSEDQSSTIWIWPPPSDPDYPVIRLVGHNLGLVLSPYLPLI